MSKNFGHEIEDSPRSERGRDRAAFWATVVAALICVPGMGPGAVLIVVGALLIAWLLRTW